MAITADAICAVTFLRPADMPAGGEFHLFADGDWASPIDAGPAEAWPHQAGLGGHYGWGHGGWGQGGWGGGGELVTMRTRDLADGVHEIGLAAYDEHGNTADPAGNPVDDVVIMGEPRPPWRPSPAAYAGGILSLSFGRSDDDDG